MPASSLVRDAFVEIGRIPRAVVVAVPAIRRRHQFAGDTPGQVHASQRSSRYRWS
jgi:hypothetical protein